MSIQRTATLILFAIRTALIAAASLMFYITSGFKARHHILIKLAHIMFRMGVGLLCVAVIATWGYIFLFA